MTIQVFGIPNCGTCKKALKWLSYRALGEEKKTWSDARWIEEFSKDAMLLKRPLFVKEGKAVLVGFRGSEAELKAKLP